MGWQDILKLDINPEREKLLDELVGNVQFFNPDITYANIAGPLNYFRFHSLKQAKALVRSLEFMRSVKDDLEIVVRGTRIFFKYNFKIFGVRCGIEYRYNNLGLISEDNYIMVGDTEVCVKATNEMTNGDFLTTLVLAVKNNAVPNILKFVAYAKNSGVRARTTVYNTNEEEYKKLFLLKLYKKWGESDLFDDNEEINIDLISEDFNLNDVNFWLAQFELPEDILGRW